MYSVVNSRPDILRLVRELQKGMKFYSNRQTNYKAANLITLECETLQFLIQKFNKKIALSIAIVNHGESTVKENENKNNALDVDIAKTVSKIHNN